MAKSWWTSFKEELAVLVYIFTFFLQLWCWLAAIYVLYASPLLRLPLLGYLAYITVGPGIKAAQSPDPWPTPLRWAPWQKAIGAYFPMELVKDADLDPDKNYIFAFHPHGIYAIGAWVNFCTEATGFSKLFPHIDIHPLTLASNFRAPLLREYLLMHGLRDVSRQSCKNILSGGSGRGIMIAVGGATESLLVRPKTYDLCLKRRKGFVRIALQTGSSLVPVLSFGENDLFSTANSLPHKSFIRRWQRSMEKAVGWTIPITLGRGFLFGKYGVMPYRVHTVTVTGPPLHITKFEGDTNSAEFHDAVEEYHAKYCTALQQLWDKYKDKYAPDRRSELTLVE